jgi:uncharacterized protein (TIGR00299 family) protein
MEMKKKILYIDCGMGAAGDMLTAALLELFPDREEVVAELNALGLPGIEYRPEVSVKCGITGTHMKVLVNGREEGPEMFGHDHGHSHDHGDEHEDEHAAAFDLKAAFAKIPSKVRKDVKAVYRLIAEAESHVHGMPVGQVHFHEVGSMDAIADVTAVCMLMCKLAPDEVVVSPVNTGTGKVKCAHGILPVPAPATAYILQGIPTYDNGILSELCTPTGAALLKHFATKFANRPVMTISALGYGMGKKDFDTANCVRTILGEAADPLYGSSSEEGTDEIIELICNIDDMTAEEIGFAYDRLFEAGAVDVFGIPAFMKKNRPGTILHVLCAPEKKEPVVKAMFVHTTTIGIREARMPRYILKRYIETRHTDYGDIRVKKVSGYGIERQKYEYDDLAAAAAAAGISIAELKEKLHSEK